MIAELRVNAFVVRSRCFLQAKLCSSSSSACSRSLSSIPPYLPPQERFDFHKHYEMERKSYKPICPPDFNFARDVMEKYAALEQKRGRQQLALWWVDDLGNERKFSFTEVNAIGKRLANGLQLVAGLKQGDRAIIVLPKLYQWWLLSLGMMRLGVTLCPGTLMLSERDLKHRIEMSKAACVITDAENAEKMERAVASIENCTVRSKIIVPSTPDRLSRPGWISYDDLLHRDVPAEHKCVGKKASDSMFIYFTSGTTGLPKMVDMPQSYALGHYTSSRYLLRSQIGDVCWSFSDPGWVKILYMQYFGPWLGGGAVFCYNNTKALNPVNLLNILKKYPISTFCGAPTLYRMFILEKLPTPADVPHLKNCLSAGEPNNPEVIEKWRRAVGVTIREGYGQSETSVVCANMPGMPQRPGSMGRVVPGYDVHVVDDNLNLVPPMTEGHLAIHIPKNKPRPLGLFREYIGAPEAMEKSFRGEYYLSGDKCYMDKDGYVYFVGRSDDVIIMAGYRIGPFEVESALIEHESVAESAVVSSPDEIKGEIVKAFVVLKPDYKDADKAQLAIELQEHCKRVTAPYKYPRKIEFLDGLPKTASGKTRRIELRQREWAGHARPRA